jgi:K+/H+ antiporter YhaU regulatory subunit KhtT
VVDFFETALRRGSEALVIEDIAVPGESRALGQTLETLDIRRATGATVLAILRDGSPVGLSGDLVIQAGDHLLALGTGEQLQRLERLLATS